MQWLAALCVRRPVFATVLVMTLAVVGAFGYSQLGIDRFPKVDFPTIMITTRQPGAAPQQIETEISDKIEEAVNTISSLDELRSTSAEGVSIVTATFLLEKNVDVAAQEVRDKVSRVVPLLPRTILQPVIEKMDMDAAPVLGIAVSAPRPVLEVTEYADKVLRRRLETVNGVGQVLVLGGRGRQINLWLDPARLRAYNLTVTEVSRALATQNLEVPGGRLEQGPKNLTLRTLGRVADVAAFSQIVVRVRDGHAITVGDVATVDDGMEDPGTLANINGKPTVILNIRRQSGTNAVQVIQAVKDRLDELRATLPAGYDITVVRDQGDFIKASINAVKEHLIVGAFLAALVVLMFLGNWRSTVIAAIAIPTSIIAAFGLIWYEGFTLNSMTMLALTLSVGIVIDDAIVVLENIYRFIEEKGQDPFKAAVEATREIGLAVLATTLSLVAIFLPIGFMGGIVGMFMKSFGLTMAFAILVSLLVSFTLTPMLAARWLKVKPEDLNPQHLHHKSRDWGWFSHLDRGYHWMLEWSLVRRKYVALIALLVLLSSGPLFMIANKNFLPVDDQSEFEIGVRAPEGTSLEATELMANRVAADVRRTYPEVQFTMVTVADDAAKTANSATIYVRLFPLEQRTRDVFVVSDLIRKTLVTQYAAIGVRTAVRPIAAMGGGGQQSAEIQFVINGPDIGKLEQYAQAIAAATRKVPGAVDVDISLNPGKPELRVSFDRAKAADLGVQIGDAAEAMRLLVGGDQVTTFNDGDEQYEVHLRALPTFRQTAADVGSLTVPSARLGAVSLDNIAAFTPGAAPSEIQRLNRDRQVTVYCSLLPGVGQTTVMDAMQAAAAGLQLDPGYNVRFAGRSRELARTGQAFLLAFGLSLVFMYLILAAQFESWLHPITILLSLPLTLPFALVSIILAGQSLNIFSGLGLLVLFGVVKKNSILQIDRANQLRDSGLSVHEAVIQASRDRLRPILMTTLSFVAGMIPLVVSSGVGSGTNRAIGFVIIGGQTLALVLTLVVTPVAYSLFDDAANLRVGSRLAGKVGGWFGARRKAAGVTGALVLACLLSGPALAQDLVPKASALPPAAGTALRLTLDEAVRMGLENNLDIRVDRFDPNIAAERVGQAKGVFVPTLTAALQRNSNLAPPSSFLVGNEGTQTTAVSGNAGIVQRLPWFGGSYATGWDTTSTKSTSFLTNYNPALTSRFQATFSQPLVKDFSIDANRQLLIVSRRNQETSDARFKETVVRTLSDVKKAYWDLVAVRALVVVQQRSLDLARELVANNRSRVEVGQAPPLDLVSAQAEEAQRDEALTVAQVSARQAEDRLRTLIFDPNGVDFWTTGIDPIDRPSFLDAAPDLDAVIAKAMKNRLDLQRARNDVAIAATNVKFSRNQTLPDLRFSMNFQSSGLGGTQLIRTGGFPGTVVGTQPVPFSQVFDQIVHVDYPTWIAGVTLTYPLGHGVEDAALARARIEAEQAKARLQNAEMKAVRQLRQAAWQIEMNARRITTSRAAQSLAEQRLSSEQKRFDVGMSTSFLVVQAQRDLLQASNNELSALLEYVKAVIEFDTLQEAGPASGGSSVSGGTVTVSGSSLSTGATAALQAASSSTVIR